MSSEESSSRQQSGVDDHFFAAAYERIVRILAVLLPASSISFWIFFDHRFAIGFFLGGTIAIANFLSLKKLVIAFADRVIASSGERRSSGLVLRFLLRYGIVALVGYAIFKSSAMSAYGLLAGLAILAVGIMLEAGYELYGSWRRGY